MIYSKSTQYAIRAMLHLAGLAPGELCRLEVIAREADLPQHFLAKILQRLARRRLVRSTKGLGGGFALGTPAREITLFKIADAVDDLSVTIGDCVFGAQVCGDDNPCPLHDSWVKVRETEIHFLESITIADLSGPLKRPSISRKSAR
jgi:Rrf2 family protein